MSGDPYRLRQKRVAHLLWLGLMPAGVHLFFTVIFGLEAETSGFMLFSAVVSAGSIGAFLFKRRYGPVETALAAAWPAVLASWRHWYWSLGMPSPGGSAQGLVRTFGWPDAPSAAAVAAVLVPFGAAGWLFMRFDRWYEMKTGCSLFEER